MKLSKSLFTISIAFFLFSHATAQPQREERPSDIQNVQVKQPDVGYSPSIPSEKSKEKIVYTTQQLQNNPKKLEALLVELIRMGNPDGLKLLLPIYKKTPKNDPAVFDWGTAIISMKERNYKKAVELYRKLQASNPNGSTLRYQLSLALMANGELEAAKDQLEKLRSSLSQPSDINLVDSYINSINKRDAWEFSGALTYAYDKNVNSAAPLGTKITSAGGATVTSKAAPIKAYGINYNLGADKKWSLSGARFIGLHGTLSGTWYKNQPSYSDLKARVGVGYGISTPQSTIELIPFVQKRLYGFGDSGDEKLHAYATTGGITLKGNHWFTPTTRYQGRVEYGKDVYVDKYSHLDGRTLSLSNTLLHAVGKNQLIYGGFDFNTKNARDGSGSFSRQGLRIGWQKEWSDGLSTSANMGYGRRVAKRVDFFNIRRKDHEYHVDVSVWNRSWHWQGVTPRLTFSHNVTKSNNPFYEYKDNKFYLELSKTF